MSKDKRENPSVKNEWPDLQTTQLHYLVICLYEYRRRRIARMNMELKEGF